MSTTINGNGNFHNFRDIHYLDGKLHKYNIHTRYSVQLKNKIITNLMEIIHKRGNPNIRDFGLKGLAIIRNDIGKHPNFSNPDNLLADDILCDIHDLLMEIKDNEVINTTINHICEQMHDMIQTNGYCPQGRCTRLFEVYI